MSEPPITPYNFPIDFALNFLGTPIEGPEGAEVQLRTTATHIQWKRDDEDETAWRDLFSLADVGLRMRVFEDVIQWAPTAVDTWSDIATLESLRGFEGLSAYQVWVAAGNVGTVADYLLWLANAQIGAVTPFVDRAELAADQAEGFKTQAGASVVSAGNSAAAAAADRVITNADRVATGQDKAASQQARTDTIAARDAGAASAVTATNKAAEAVAARNTAVTAKEAVDIAKAATDAARNRAVQAEDAAEAAQAGAEAARDQAQAIAGGNFQAGDATLTAVAAQTWTSGKVVFAMTAQDVFTPLKVGASAATDLLDRAAGDGRYRLGSTALVIGDVTNLQSALDAKATPADIQAAVDALVAGAPGALDTLYEIAAKFAADDDAMAALMGVVAEKAGQDAVDLLTARVAALEAIKPILTINGLTPEPDGNIAFSVEVPIPSEIVLARTAGVLTTITETVEGDPRITTLTRTAGVLSQTVTTYRGKTVTNIFNRTAGRLTGVTTTEA